MHHVDTLKLASNPESSTLQWLTDTDRSTPLEIVGAGPKVLAMAGKYSNRPAIAVGAVPERVDWAVRRSGRREPMPAWLRTSGCVPTSMSWRIRTRWSLGA